MSRRLSLFYLDNSRPATNKELKLIRKGNVLFEGKTDSKGAVRVDFSDDWIDKVLLDDREVKSDWDLGTGEEVELWIKRSGGREMKFHYGDGSPLKGAEIMVFRSGEVIGKGQTNDLGHALLELKSDWADRIEADGNIVATDIDLDKKSFDFRAQRPEEIHGRDEGEGFFSFDDREERVIRGRIYLPNGRVAEGVGRVSVLSDQGEFFDNSVKDGWFTIPLPASDASDRLLGQNNSSLQIFVDGQAPATSFWDNNSRTWTVMCDRGAQSIVPFLDDNTGSKGGLITGRALNSKGLGLPDCKVSADLGSSIFDMSFESSLGGSDWVSSLIMGGGAGPVARTNKNGFFVLHLPYGDCAKKIFVDGDEPVKIISGDFTLPNRDIRPGSFNLELWAPRKVFRDFLG